jgi:hypothetical protein
MFHATSRSLSPRGSSSAVRATEPQVDVMASWRAYHLYYHGDQDRLLLELVRPTVAKLLSSTQIESFFFVRYALGGPHIRLRLHTSQASIEVVHEAVMSAAARFFARSPSMVTLPEQVVREENERLRRIDPHEVDPKLCADNTCVSVDPHFEVMRYGGTEMLEHSLNYFAVSSVYALEVCTASSTSRLGAALRSLVWQAWGFARNGAEFIALLEYIRVYWEGLWRQAIERADSFFEERRERISQLLCSELEAVTTGNTDEDSAMLERLADGAQLVAAHTSVSERDLRLSIGMSHMHMTANRIGLTNIEEAHVGRVLSRAVQEVARASPEWWKKLWQSQRSASCADLSELRLDSCARLCHTLGSQA